MSTIVCAISGHSPEEPVFSPKTGYVYEKRLITKHLQSVGKCPVTKEEITQDDLVDMKANKAVRPRPAQATSIPGMLSLLQGEWDALMTETYELKTHLDTTRKQLSHALYQHDAACRVIARLLRERDAARAEVTGLQDQISNMKPGDDVPMEEDDNAETGITPQMIERMQELAKTLSRTRKAKNFPGLAAVADVQKLECAGSHPTHQSTAPGILCLDVHKSDDNRIVTGGVDQQVLLFDAGEEKLVQKLLGHSKKITSVVFHPTNPVVLSSSLDTTARVWTCKDASNWKSAYECTHVVRKHEADVSAVSVHPLGDIFLTASRDKSWALHDFSTGRCVRHVKEHSAGFSCMKFHPDGLILAGGTDKRQICVMDIKDQVTVATLDGHEGEITALSFSENGYYLATASTDGEVKLWDLRKPLNIQTLKCDGPANAVCFDRTGQYLAVGSSTLKVYNFETKSSLKSTIELSDHTGAVMGVCFGQHARSVASVSMDRAVKLYKIK